MQRLHSHAFYLYGVVVGLAIREALTRVGPHIFLPSGLDPWKVHLEAWRLVIFMMAISCFYFGSGVFFDKVYLSSDADTRFSKRSYGIDFVLGLIHFVAFFACALTIDNFSTTIWGMSPFLGFLGGIFLYDLVWLLANIFFDTVQEIKVWARWATIVWLFSTVVFVIWRSAWHNDAAAEEAAFVVYGLYLIFDAVELFIGKPIFLDLMKRALPRGPAS